MIQKQHSINKLVMEIRAATTVDAQAQQQEMSSWLEESSFWQTIETAFDRIAPQDRVIEIPKLELEIQSGDKNKIREIFIENLVEAVHKAIRSSTYTRSISLDVYTEEVTLFFLKNGTLPWQISTETATIIPTFLEKLVLTPDASFLATLQQQASQSPVMWRRLVYNISVTQLKTLAKNWLKLPAEALDWLDKLDKKHADSIWELILQNSRTETNILIAKIAEWRVSFQSSAIMNVSRNSIKESENTSGAQHSNTDDHTAPTASNNKSTIETEVGEYLSNAGLVLLWQFLPQLFQRLNYTQDRHFINESTQQQAALLLQYLAVGHTECYEYEMTLNKILCGIPLEEPIDYRIELDETKRQEADLLLKAAIEQWTILKNTSPAGLRENFLRRAGKLSKDADGNWRLQVERKTIDILLERLPMGWGFSLIKLPWMPKILFVEW